MIRTSSATWRRLALDIRMHNLTMVMYPTRPTMGRIGDLWCAANVVIGILSNTPAGVLFGGVFFAILVADKNPAQHAAPYWVIGWRDAHKIAPDVPIPELPPDIPRRLLPAKDDYTALLLAARNGDLDE